MRIQILLFLSLLISTAALKGVTSKMGVRGLVAEGEPEGPEGGPKTDKDDKKKEKDPKKEKAAKKDEKSSKKDKKDKKSEKKPKKKCKKAKSKKESSESSSDDEVSAEIPDEIPETLPYCLQGSRTAEECAAARKGEIPVDDKSVSGDLKLEISYEESSSPERVLSEVEDVLRSETAPKFMGCKGRRLQDDTVEGTEETDETDDSDEAVVVTGVNFGDLVVSDEECASTGTDLKCDKIRTDIEIYYDGDEATEDEKSDMFALLIATIESQAATGSFNSAGAIGSIDSDADDGSSAKNYSSSGDGSKSPALPIGVVTGVVVAIVVIGAIWFFSRKKDASDTSSKDGAHTIESGQDYATATPIEVTPY